VKNRGKKSKEHRQDYSALTTYSIKLIKFYNFLVRIKERCILQLIFFYTIFMLLFKLPVYFFTSFFGISVTYAEPAAEETEKPTQLVKTKKTFSDRTILSTLVRKSLKKDFIQKYFGTEPILKDHELNDEVKTFTSSDFFASLDVQASKRGRFYRKNSIINMIDLPIVTAENFRQQSLFSTGTTKYLNNTYICTNSIFYNNFVAQVIYFFISYIIFCRRRNKFFISFNIF
jgi:hypothetical protein